MAVLRVMSHGSVLQSVSLNVYSNLAVKTAARFTGEG